MAAIRLCEVLITDKENGFEEPELFMETMNIHSTELMNE